MESLTSINKLLLSDISVPEIFLIQYAHKLSKNAILVYLYILRFSNGESISLKSVGDFNFLAKSEREDALAELINEALIIVKNKNIYLVDLKKNEIDEYINRNSGVSSDPSYLGADEKKRNELAESISASFYMGAMPYNYYRLVDTCLYKYQMSSEVVYTLFSEGHRIGKSHINDMERMAYTWSSHGITDINKLASHMEKQEQIREIVLLAGKLLKKRINGIDMEYIEKWVLTYNFSSDIIEYAIRQNNYRSNISFGIIDKTISEWVAHGITKLEDAVLLEAEKHKENKSKSTRKKSRYGKWETASEAGVSFDDIEIASSDSKDSIEDESILDIFGGDKDND